MQHAVKRGAASVAGGSLVLGAGLALGLVAGRMQQDWLTAQAQRDAAETAQARAGLAAEPPRPVVVTEVRVRHVTPEPVVVHRTVVKRVAGQTASTPRSPAARPAATPAAKPDARQAGKPAARPSRTTVAPAPAPQPARTTAPAATTSKTS